MGRHLPVAMMECVRSVTKRRASEGQRRPMIVLQRISRHSGELSRHTLQPDPPFTICTQIVCDV